MPLLVLCGQPASGKSTVAAQLVQLLEQAGHSTHVVDEPSLHLQRNSSYSTNVQEKNTRAALKSTVERVISPKTVVILDSLNNIKGYRYELWCIARAAATRYGMVHVDTPVELCKQWNLARDDSRYSEDVFTDLSGRFERPDARNRWDAPLFTVQPGRPDAAAEMAEVLQAAVDAMTGVEQAGRSNVPGRSLQPTAATTNPALLSTNLLHDIDQAAQEVITRICEAQSTAGGGAAGRLDLGAEGGGSLDLHQHVSLAELRRIKRAFLKLATKITFARVQDPSTAQRMFVEYLKEQQLAGPGAIT